ncbi:uncharacterized protein LOC134073806 isoform X2 [Sardina pilchardus]|uniref:uncharacterized protein LOC134073806 isoform X2 n=1 Tax=Sardina pilchardus TaxID=27697 RepID=UPI002E126001
MTETNKAGLMADHIGTPNLPSNVPSRLSSMATDQTDVCSILDNLGEEERERFAFYLKSPILEGWESIPKCKLEKQTTTGIVSVMQENYGHKRSMEITYKILKKMGRGDLVNNGHVFFQLHKPLKK